MLANTNRKMNFQTHSLCKIISLQFQSHSVLLSMLRYNHSFIQRHCQNFWWYWYVTGIVRILDDMDMPQTLSEYIMIQICHRYCQNIWWCKYYDKMTLCENMYYDASPHCKNRCYEKNHTVLVISIILICHRHWHNTWWYRYITDIVRMIDDMNMSQTLSEY